MKALIKSIVLLGLFGCSVEQGFHSDSYAYGDSTATSLDNGVVTDFFIPVHEDPVDILFVVDNSCSMDDDQKQLARNLPQLSNKLLEMDMNFRIGFTTTSIFDYGNLRELPSNRGDVYWIEKDTPNKEELFVYGAMPGTHGMGYESGFYGTYCFVENCDDSPKLLRRDSSFHVIVVSDEPEQGESFDSYGDEYREVSRRLKPRNFIPWFKGLRESSTFNIIGGDEYGSQNSYNRTARETGGYIIGLEENRWDAFTENIIENTEFNPEYRFYLSHIPADYRDIKIKLCVDMDTDNQCVAWRTSPDITYVYKYDKKFWSYSYDEDTNSIVLISPQRKVQDYDEVTVTYEVETGTSY